MGGLITPRQTAVPLASAPSLALASCPLAVDRSLDWQETHASHRRDDLLLFHRARGRGRAHDSHRKIEIRKSVGSVFFSFSAALNAARSNSGTRLLLRLQHPFASRSRLISNFQPAPDSDMPRSIRRAEHYCACPPFVWLRAQPKTVSANGEQAPKGSDLRGLGSRLSSVPVPW